MEWPAKDQEMIFYIQRRLRRPWGGFEFSQVQWLLDKLLEARQELEAKNPDRMDKINKMEDDDSV